jgi:hypothetical protein
VTNLSLGSCVQRFLCMRGQKSTHVPKKWVLATLRDACETDPASCKCAASGHRLLAPSVSACWRFPGLSFRHSTFPGADPPRLPSSVVPRVSVRSFTLSDRAGLPRLPPPAGSVRSRWRCFEALLPLRNRRPTVWCLCGKPKQETEVSLRTAVARELSDDDLAAIAIGGEDEKIQQDPKADSSKLN